MNLVTKVSSGILLGLVWGSVVMAAPDIEAGKQRAAMCFNCHGAGGNSQNPNVPSLAGQKPAYLANQLRAFREGTRTNGMMQNMAGGLSNEEINNIAAFLASLPSKSAGGESALAKKGQSKVTLCFGCHGSGAKGMGVTPKLAGQHPAYLQRQLAAFKDGSRKNGPMRGIANMLSDDDIIAVTEYLGSLQ